MLRGATLDDLVGEVRVDVVDSVELHRGRSDRNPQLDRRRHQVHLALIRASSSPARFLIIGAPAMQEHRVLAAPEALCPGNDEIAHRLGPFADSSSTRSNTVGPMPAMMKLARLGVRRCAESHENGRSQPVTHVVLPPRCGASNSASGGGNSTPRLRPEMRWLHLRFHERRRAVDHRLGQRQVADAVDEAVVQAFGEDELVAAAQLASFS